MTTLRAEDFEKRGGFLDVMCAELGPQFWVTTDVRRLSLGPLPLQDSHGPNCGRSEQLLKAGVPGATRQEKSHITKTV